MKAAIAVLALISVSAAVFAGEAGMRIVDDGRLGKIYTPVPGTQLAAPAYPAAYADAGDDVCIALGYTIRPDGTTAEFQLLRAWSSNGEAARMDERYLDAYAAAATDLVAGWRFIPGSKANAAPVKTVATMAFEGHGRVKKLADRCRIPELASSYRAGSRDGHRWLLIHKRNVQNVGNLVAGMNQAQVQAQWILDHSSPLVTSK